MQATHLIAVSFLISVLQIYINCALHIRFIVIIYYVCILIQLKMDDERKSEYTNYDESAYTLVAKWKQNVNVLSIIDAVHSLYRS